MSAVIMESVIPRFLARRTLDVDQKVENCKSLIDPSIVKMCKGDIITIVVVAVLLILILWFWYGGYKTVYRLFGKKVEDEETILPTHTQPRTSDPLDSLRKESNDPWLQTRCIDESLLVRSGLLSPPHKPSPALHSRQVNSEYEYPFLSPKAASSSASSSSPVISFEETKSGLGFGHTVPTLPAVPAAIYPHGAGSLSSSTSSFINGDDHSAHSHEQQHTRYLSPNLSPERLAFNFASMPSSPTLGVNVRGKSVSPIAEAHGKGLKGQWLRKEMKKEGERSLC